MAEIQQSLGPNLENSRPLKYLNMAKTYLENLNAIWPNNFRTQEASNQATGITFSMLNKKCIPNHTITLTFQLGFKVCSSRNKDKFIMGEKCKYLCHAL